MIAPADLAERGLTTIKDKGMIAPNYKMAGNRLLQIEPNHPICRLKLVEGRATTINRFDFTVICQHCRNDMGGHAHMIRKILYRYLSDRLIRRPQVNVNTIQGKFFFKKGNRGTGFAVNNFNSFVPRDLDTFNSGQGLLLFQSLHNECSKRTTVSGDLGVER